jgi:hypothetical protein
MGRPWIRPAIAEALDLPCAQYLPCPDNTPGTAVLKEGSVHAGLTRAPFACVRRKAARAQQISLTGPTAYRAPDLTPKGRGVIVHKHNPI